MKHASNYYSWENLISTAKNRREAAVLYSLVIKQEPEEANWPAINAAIIERWSVSGLEYIKRLAWKMTPR